jgi:hypothetical protein
VNRLIRTGSAISQLLNVLIFDGDENHSVSGDAYRYKRHSLRRVIDWLASPWEKDHCRLSHENDVAKAARLLQEQRV